MLMYGGSRGGSSYGYYFADKAGIPKVENGGYYFIDRQQDTERQVFYTAGRIIFLWQYMFG